jgi:hypothetical protein
MKRYRVILNDVPTAWHSKTAMLLNYRMTPGNMHVVEVGRKVLARDSIISEGSVLLVYSQPTDALHKHTGMGDLIRPAN